MNNTNWFKVGLLAGLGLVAAVVVVAIGLWTLGVIGDAANKLSAEAEIKRAQAEALKAQANAEEEARIRQIENAKIQAKAQVRATVQAQAIAQARTQAELEQRQALAEQIQKQAAVQAELDRQQAEQAKQAETDRQAELALQQESERLFKEMINNLVTDKTICIFQRVGDSLGIEWNVSGANVVLYQDGTPTGLRISITSGMEGQTYPYKLVALGADKSVVASRTLILKVNSKDVPARLLCDDTTVLDSSDPHFR